MTIFFNFFNSHLDMSCRSRLAELNEKLTALERRVEYIEARVSHSCLLQCTTYCTSHVHKFTILYHMMTG